jgi:hypothetical protein
MDFFPEAFQKAQREGNPVLCPSAIPDPAGSKFKDKRLYCLHAIILINQYEYIQFEP